MYFYEKEKKTQHNDLILFSYAKYAPLYTKEYWFK